MKTFLFLTLLVAHVNAIEPPQDASEHEAQSILAVEKTISATFLTKGASADGHSIRWIFKGEAVHGVPVFIDLIAFPDYEQAIAAAVAAYSEAARVSQWLETSQKTKSY